MGLMMKPVDLLSLLVLGSGVDTSSTSSSIRIGGVGTGDARSTIGVTIGRSREGGKPDR